MNRDTESFEHNADLCPLTAPYARMTRDLLVTRLVNARILSYSDVLAKAIRSSYVENPAALDTVSSPQMEVIRDIDLLLSETRCRDRRPPMLCSAKIAPRKACLICVLGSTRVDVLAALEISVFSD